MNNKIEEYHCPMEVGQEEGPTNLRKEASDVQGQSTVCS